MSSFIAKFTNKWIPKVFDEDKETSFAMTDDDDNPIIIDDISVKGTIINFNTDADADDMEPSLIAIDLTDVFNEIEQKVGFDMSENYSIAASIRDNTIVNIYLQFTEGSPG